MHINHSHKVYDPLVLSDSKVAFLGEAEDTAFCPLYFFIDSVEINYQRFPCLPNSRGYSMSVAFFFQYTVKFLLRKLSLFDVYLDINNFFDNFISNFRGVFKQILEMFFPLLMSNILGRLLLVLLLTCSFFCSFHLPFNRDCLSFTEFLVLSRCS